MSSIAALLRTEWLKIKRYKPFWVVFVLYPVCLGSIVTIALWGQKKIQSAASDAGAGGVVDAYLPFAFPTVWQSVAYLASWLHFVPAVLLVLVVTNEFSFRSHRQNLLEGWSRAQFLLAKVALTLGLSLYCTAVAALFTGIAGAVSGSAPTLGGARFLVLLFLQSSVYGMFALLLAFLIRRAALSLAAFLMYSMILENILAFFVNLQWSGFGGYLPLEAASGLVPIPFVKENAPEAAKELLAGPSETALIVVSVLYLVAFTAVLWGRFRKEDL